MHSTMARGLVFGLGISFLAACAGLPDLRPPPPDPVGRYVVLTTPFVAMGDTQEHEATGLPMHDNDSAVDAYVEVAQRPPEQPLFGRKIFETVLASHPDEPLLHLGDVLDVSCWSEANRMKRIFAAAGQPKAILPGNHDGLLFGIFNYNIGDIVRDPDGARWERACRRGTWLEGDRPTPSTPRAAFSKGDFIALYLDAHANGSGHLQDIAMPSGDGEQRLSWQNPDAAGFIQAMEVSVTPGERYARSFIIQKLRLPAAADAPRRVTLIGLDTNQLDVMVGTLDAMRGQSPGDVGHILKDQIDVAAAWVDEARRRGDIVVFAGHHHFASFSPVTRQRVAGLMARVENPLVYLSAHTHGGFWNTHTVAGRALLELNVSSLSDWPVAYRRVSFQYDAEAARLKVVGELMPNGGEVVGDDAGLLTAWERQTCQQGEVPLARLEARDLELVKTQKAARGSLMEWVYSSFWEVCESCLDVLYEHSHRYMDMMLREIRQTRTDLGKDSAELVPARLPSSCSEVGLDDCVELLLAAKPEDLKSRMALFRQKAELVDRVSQRIDRITSPRARAYMSCRAVLAAKDDFDLTPEARIPRRALARRLSGDYFRSEATVGMEVLSTGPSETP